jgi:hypothetical protein
MDKRAVITHSTYRQKSWQPPRYSDPKSRYPPRYIWTSEPQPLRITDPKADSLHAIRTLTAGSLHANEPESRHPQCYTDIGEDRLYALWNQIRLRKIDVGVNSLDRNMDVGVRSPDAMRKPEPPVPNTTTIVGATSQPRAAAASTLKKIVTKKNIA